MEQASYEIDHFADDVIVVKLFGNWQMGMTSPRTDGVCQRAKDSSATSVSFDSSMLQKWDTSLLTFVIELEERLRQIDISLADDGLPDGVKQLLSLAKAVPKKQELGRDEKPTPFLVRVGEDTLSFCRSTGELLSFVGEVTLPLLRILSAKPKFRMSDLGVFLQETGAYAVPIVSLISFLFGVILAFVGIMQLKLFGAQIYVADLVGIATVRVMGAVMTGIIMAGRTGAAFAAQLGTMQVNEEIDALKTLAVSPIEFLVLPRLIALTVMMPLLTLFANLMGVAGGAFVACGVYDIKVLVYFNRVCEAVTLNDLYIGLFKGLVFGILISLAGCLRGIQCGRDASAVGDATTSAVVTSIVAIIIATALIIVVCSLIGI